MLETLWYELASRSGGWLAVLAVGALKAAVILALAGAVALVLRGASAAVRHQVWLVGVVCALAVPLLGAVLPDIRVPGPAWLAAPGEDSQAWWTFGSPPFMEVPAEAEWSSAAVAEMEGEIAEAVAHVAEMEGEIAEAVAHAAELEDEIAEAVARAEEVAHASVRVDELAAQLDEFGARADELAARAGGAVAAAAAANAIRVRVPHAIAPTAPIALAPSVSVIAVPQPPVPIGYPPYIGPAFEGGSSGWDGGFPWALPLLGLWLFGVWVVSAGIVAGAMRVGFIGWQASPVTSGRCATLAAAIADELGLRDVRVLLGPSTTMPMTWGLFRTTVLLPEGAESWPVDQLDAALRHEMAHARRRDTLTQLIADITCALYWFNPLAWLAAHRLRVEREHACDDEVLASGSKPSDYATQLLDMTRALRAARLTAMAAIPMARPSQLRGRLEAVLDDDRVRGGLSKPARTRGWAAGFLFALPIALLGFSPVSSFADGFDHDFEFADEAFRGGEHPPAHPRAIAHAYAGARPAHAPALSLPGEWQVCERGRKRAGYSISIDDDEQRIEWYDDDCRRTVEIDGSVVFDDEFRRIVALSRGGRVRIEAETSRGERALELDEADGELVYTYYEDGDERPFDENARAWLDELVLEWLRTGYMAEERVAALLQTGGVEAVVEEVEYLRSDLARRVYYGAALADADVTHDEAVELITLAADGIQSDFELAELLIATADDRPFTGAITNAFLEASRSVSSDFERRRVLSEVLMRASLSGEHQGALIASAAELRSDFDKTELLVTLANGGIGDVDVQSAYVEAAASIRSDHDRRRALDAILAETRLPADVVTQVIRAAGELRSDHDKAEALLHVARTQTLDDESLAEFIDAVATIRSDYDHDRVSSAVRRSNR